MNPGIGTATPPPQPIQHPSGPNTYVPLPRRLLEDLRDSPIAIGIYALIGRLTQITGAPIPLSATDLHAYDPTLSYGAARRALDRLNDAGYALVERQNGRKGHYVPTWGLIQGTHRPWDYSLSHVGRPRHLAMYRLDDRLLDLCIGALRPHPTHPALISRYLVTPLLTLRDVGAYALALARIPVTSTTLATLGLLDTLGRPQPLPDEATVLAIASQRRAATEDGGLTPEGWQRVGVVPKAAPEAVATALFFVPPEVIGGLIGNPDAPLIGNLIGMAEPHTGLNSPSGRGISTVDSPRSASHGSDGNHVPNPTTRMSGGGDDSDQSATAQGRSTEGHSAPDRSRHAPMAKTMDTDETAASDSTGAPTASEQCLRAIGVRREIARAFAAYPLAQVERVIAQARARRDVRDPAGWVVSALRQVPAVTESPPPPKVSVGPIWDHPGLTPRERATWLHRFRSADPADRPAIIARLYAEHPCEVSV